MKGFTGRGLVLLQVLCGCGNVKWTHIVYSVPAPSCRIAWRNDHPALVVGL